MSLIIRLRSISILFALVALLGCQSPRRSAKKPKKNSGTTALTNDTLYNDQTSSPPKKAGKAYPKTSGAPLDSQLPPASVLPDQKSQIEPKIPSNTPVVMEYKNNCTNLVERFAPYYKTLITLLSPTSRTAHQERFAPIESMKVQDCHDDLQLGKTLANLRSLTTTHQTCIGVILPLTGASQKATAGIMKGLQAAFRDLKPAAYSAMPLEQIFRIRDSGGSPSQAKKWFAELTLADQCGLIVGGLDSAEATQLIPLSQGVQQPLMLLSSRTPIPAEALSVYSLFPSEYRLAQSLIQSASQKSIKKVAILRPNNGKSDRLIEQFKTQFAAMPGNVIVDDVTYAAGQFDAMQAATRKLFRSDIIGREQEYREAVLRAKKAADLAKEKFNPKMVLLKPQVTFDALFIPDDFRTVRHIVKLIKYHMVDKLVLFGNHEWRSQGLLTPPEPFLEGSFFADFVPRYDQTPTSLPVALDGSPFFAAPQMVAAMDFQLIGYHAGRVLLKALEQSPKNRLAYLSVLNDLKVSNSMASAPKPAFDNQRRALWPTFAYTVSQGALKSLPLTGPAFARSSHAIGRAFRQ